MSFIAGRYGIVYGNSPVSVGQVRDPILEHYVNKQLVVGDNFGTAPQDAVYQGMEVFLEFTLLEFDAAGALDVFWPYDDTSGVPGVIGRTDVGSGVAQEIKLSPLTGTPAAGAAAGPGGTNPVFNATYAILAEGFPVRLLKAPALKEIPIRLRLYPDSANNNRFYFWTAPPA